MVRQPLYGRQEAEYRFNVFIVDGCGAGASFIPVTVFFRRNRFPPVFQVIKHELASDGAFFHKINKLV